MPFNFYPINFCFLQTLFIIIFVTSLIIYHTFNTLIPNGSLSLDLSLPNRINVYNLFHYAQLLSSVSSINVRYLNRTNNITSKNTCNFICKSIFAERLHSNGRSDDSKNGSKRCFFVLSIFRDTYRKLKVKHD